MQVINGLRVILFGSILLAFTKPAVAEDKSARCAVLLAASGGGSLVLSGRDAVREFLADTETLYERYRGTPLHPNLRDFNKKALFFGSVFAIAATRISIELLSILGFWIGTDKVLRHVRLTDWGRFRRFRNRVKESLDGARHLSSESISIELEAHLDKELLSELETQGEWTMGSRSVQWRDDRVSAPLALLANFFAPDGADRIREARKRVEVKLIFRGDPIELSITRRDYDK